MDLDATSLKPFFDHAVDEIVDFLKTSPEKIVSGARRRPIGFT